MVTKAFYTERPAALQYMPLPGAAGADLWMRKNIAEVEDPETGAVMLGDMMISVPRCKAQGEEFGHGYQREIMYLTVHSVLHLLGYDHVDEGEMKKQMRTREKIIMGDN